MKFENLKIWLSLPVVFFQYRRDVRKRYAQAGSSDRLRYCVALVFVVALSLGFLLFKGGLPQSFVADVSALSSGTPEFAPAADTFIESNP